MKHSERLDTQHNHNVLRKLRIDPQTAWSWAAAIVAALVVFLASRGTQYHQLTLGVLLSSVTLLVALSLFEVLWRLFEVFFDADQSDAADRSD